MFDFFHAKPAVFPIRNLRRKGECQMSDTGRIALLFLLLVLTPLSTATVGRADEVDAADVDTTTMVIMAPGGPVFADMKILVDGRSYRLWVTEFLERKLDIDSNGSLTLSELKLIPDRLLQQVAARNPKQILRRASGKKKADAVSAEQFNTWFSNQLSRSFNVIAGAVKASEAVRLATLIDQDGDGGISKPELQQGSRTLRFRDLDDDQTFSAAELMPYRDPRNQAAAVIPDVANLPFVQLTDEPSIVRTAEQLLKRYGDGTIMPVESLRLSDAVKTTADADADGSLDAKECQTFLKSPAFHITLEVLLSDRSNASELVFDMQETAAAFCKATAGRRGRATLVIDEMPINIRARGGGTGARKFFVSFLLQRMSLHDKDKNNYLSEEEFPAMRQEMMQQQINANFKDVDLNSDGMLFRQEVLGYIERDAISTQSKIEVSVKQEGKTLFSILDKDLDRRLTPREFNEGFEALMEYDVNGDNKLMEQELGTAYVLEIGLAQSEAFRVGSMQNRNMMDQSTDALLPGVGGLSGPEWFQRMDRNQDRDVSYREFLGPRSIFEDLDKDADDLLSAEEASQLKSGK